MNHRYGFTLLEMLMAIALSALLMIGVMAVITELGVGSVRAGVMDSSHSVADETGVAVVQLMREDLTHAVEIDATQPNHLVLLGYAGLGDERRDRVHRLVRIEYQIQAVAGQRWLVRRQTWRDVLTNQNVQRDLVCCNLSGFSVSGIPQDNKHASVVRLRLQWNDQTLQDIDQFIMVREGR